MKKGTPAPTDQYLIGVLSDTHGLIRPEVLNLLQDAYLIIHAGDVGSPEVLESLQRMAPVVAVRGNVDQGTWAEALPQTEVVEVGEILLYVIHNLDELDLDPAAAGFHAVISGHTHHLSHVYRDQVLFLNPGSIGPGKVNHPVTLAWLRIKGSSVEVKPIEISEAKRHKKKNKRKIWWQK